MIETYIFPFDKVEKGSRIIIYGASDIGRAYLSQILKLDYCECLFVVDRNYDKIEIDSKIPLLHPKKIFESDYDYIVIASSWASKNIIAFLIENGVPENKMVHSIVKTEHDGSEFSYQNYYAEYRRLPIEQECILYESSEGYGMVCNPYAIFKLLINDPDFRNFKHIWSISDVKIMRKLQSEYINYPNVSFCLRADKEKYAFYYATSKYIIVNSGPPVFFIARGEQVLLNTWHGIAIKAMGFDMPNGFIYIGKALSRFMMCDYLLAANRFMADLFFKSYKLDGLYNGKIIQEGHPRTDLTLKTKRERAIEKLLDYDVAYDPQKKAILYAPTWGESSFHMTSSEFESFLDVIYYLEEAFDDDKYQILIKPHTYTYRVLSIKEQSFCKLIPPFVDTNELLPAIDILISDYSSIFFDFMVLDRPVLFYVPDYKNYDDERGLYCKLEELPGPVTDDLDELAGWIRNIDEVIEEYKPIYSKTKEWACKQDDGQVSRRIIDIVFNKQQKYNLIAGNNDKTKILFYPGCMDNTEITEAFLALLESIDYEKFDVTAYCHDNNIENLKRIPAEARIMVRHGDNAQSIIEQSKLRAILGEGIKNGENLVLIDDMFERSFLRCFGYASFDYVVDFTGCDTESTLMLSMAKNATKYICLNDDMQEALADMETPSLANLKILIDRFDKVISDDECVEQFEALFAKKQN